MVLTPPNFKTSLYVGLEMEPKSEVMFQVLSFFNLWYVYMYAMSVCVCMCVLIQEETSMSRLEGLIVYNPSKIDRT